MKIAFISEAIRRDIHTPFRFLKHSKILHIYFDAPYGEFDPTKYSDTERVHSLKELDASLKAFAPDLVQGAEPYASRRALRICLAVRSWCRRHHVPYFFPMLENRSPRIKFGPLVGPVMQKVLGFYARAAAFVLYVNKGSLSNLRAAGVPSDRLVAFYHGIWGVDPALFYPAPSKRAAQPTILFVGRLVEEKGIADLLGALPLIAADVSQVTLEIAGQGPLLGQIKEWVRTHNMERFVHFGGMLNGAALTEAFQRAWVVAAPAWSVKKWEEQIGMVNLQALACGTPVVATVTGAIPEYIPQRRAGILVPEHDPIALSQALIEILNNKPLLATLRKGAEKIATERYLSPVTMAALEAIVAQRIKQQ